MQKHKFKVGILFLVLSFNISAQSDNSYYTEASLQLLNMLENDNHLNFKKTVYITENAYFKLYDRPERANPDGKNFYWKAETSLIERSRQGNISIMTLSWGFYKNRSGNKGIYPIRVVNQLSTFHKDT